MRATIESHWAHGRSMALAPSSMSALLATTMPYMKVVIDALIEKGVRNDYVVLVGGAPLNEQFANAIGADAYCRDASWAVDTAKAFMAKRQGSAAAKMAAGG